jgi:hypothetical protein
MDREYEPNPDDERVEPLLEDDDEPIPPPTLDPDERVEGSDDRPVRDEDRPA